MSDSYRTCTPINTQSINVYKVQRDLPRPQALRLPFLGRDTGVVGKEQPSPSLLPILELQNCSLSGRIDGGSSRTGRNHCCQVHGYNTMTNKTTLHYLRYNTYIISNQGVIQKIPKKPAAPAVRRKVEPAERRAAPSEYCQ